VGAGRYRPRTGSRQAMMPVPVPYDISANTRVDNANVDTAAINQASKDQMYENKTKKIVTKKKGKGFLNDEINFNALLRWLNENVSNTVTNAITTSPMVGYNDSNKLATQKNLIGAKDKVGQNRGVLSEMGLNAIENIVTGKGSRNDVKSLAYWLSGNKSMAALGASDATRFLRDKKVPFTNISAADALFPKGVNQAEKLGTAGINKFIDLLTKKR
jgi:hypothetical protein